jgi:hypothetical protein
MLLEKAPSLQALPLDGEINETTVPLRAGLCGLRE